MPSERDSLWSSYVKDIKPAGRASRSKHSERTKPAPALPKSQPPPKSQVTALPKPLRPKTVAPVDIVLDRRKEKQLRQGRLPIEARLDLHGMTQKEARAALEKFLVTQIRAGHRYLLVITGKGRQTSDDDARGERRDGVLRASLPGWLETLPTAEHVLALRPAAARLGGTGAFTIILKRTR